MRNIIVVLVIIIALATVAGAAVDFSQYKQTVSDSQWHTKLNNFIDAVGDQVSAAIAALQTSIDGLSRNVIYLATTITKRAISENCLIFINATPTYSDGDTFTMPGDYTSRFAVGKIVHAYCGSDGMKYSTVASSSFGGGITTVELNTSVLTFNLTQIFVVATRDGLFPNGPGYIVAADYGSPGRTALEAADAVAAVAGQMLVIGPGTWIIDHDVTLAAPVKIMPGAVLAIADTKKLTFNHQPEAGIFPIFSRTSTGKVAGLTTLYPEWFGAFGGGVTDDTKAFTFMIDSLQSNSTVKFTKAVYLQDDLTTIQNLDNLKIEGIGNTTLTSAGAAVYAFPSHPDLRAFKFDTCNNVIVRGIDFDRAGSKTKANTNALLFYNCYNPLLENCLFSDADYGVKFLETTTYPTVRNCKFTCPLSYSAENRANNYLMRNGIIFGDKDGCHHILIENCHTTGSGVGGLFYSGVGINYVEVKSCSTRFNFDSAIYAKGSYINFHDNQVYYPGKEGIKAIGGSFPGEAISTNVTINNNTIFGTGIITGGGSIDIIASRGNVTNNIIYMAAAPFSLRSNTGIYVMGNHLLVDNNQIYFSPPINLDDWKYTVGISLLARYQPLNYAVVSNNTISGPATGVQLFPGDPKQISNYVTIKGNKLISNRLGIGNHCIISNLKAYDNEIIDWQYYAVYSSVVLTGSLWENNKFLLPNIAANGVLLAENFVNTIFNNNLVEVNAMTDVLVANGGSITFAARKGNKIKNLTTGQVFELDASYLLSSGAVANGSTPGKAKTTATTTGVALGGTLTKAATDDLWDLTKISTGAGEYRKVALIIKSGNTADIIVGDVGASQGAAPLPPLSKYCGTTAASFAAIVAGVVELPPSFSGGDLSGFVFYDLPGYYPF